MDSRAYSKEEVTRIVNSRLYREREKMTKDFETRMKRCMASLHLMLYQEMCEMKNDAADKMQEPPLRAAEPIRNGLTPSFPEKLRDKGSAHK